ncbi:MAG: hypothetical protein UV82_C0013G0061 [Candidatus Magasanikbacteria bacterium GW2011_GWD2_43_18]|uniref:Uncharacterized protein n=1 Tax=Candidatus Magasanikbacteria bacterium GW2011_GWE2_42_7 TaxID=1619052 RepID=A0A0G1BI58_9BACT|nr:MAG: hypothetical protein UV18_C0002G0087 [Candidatus Magasanikbacteria bacterium GW2011_GWC2_42_27]KKS73037.1 MAG: hypothetical protein UV42_C0002G0017 [Candidatus Magasanikbacteria bacterium GW2011_GWE2_42_7]KKT03977.1 MAG: hypothetical protein UV82_C0013G0061 [Candidatus Magasanikbacteria bacterium GW2011_GWD2_43_18]KKT25540.1 MAG: hypothetical protein UW10_C0006G0006 [Candidatus Magasanikbacteria bacterium GW2011_GWA2_43_9]HBB37721.1 hypothetical protein [Candidatus Magasanikbacteria bac
MTFVYIKRILAKVLLCFSPKSLICWTYHFTSAIYAYNVLRRTILPRIDLREDGVVHVRFGQIERFDGLAVYKDLQSQKEIKKTKWEQNYICN